MTANEFNAECAKRGIDSAIALENEAVVIALKRRDEKALIETLDNEF